MSIDIGFILKQAVSALIMPLSIGLLLAIVALLYLHKNKIKKAKVLLSIASLWILLISYKPFSFYLLKPLESQYPKLTKIPNNIHYVLLLGGDKNNRTWEALRLYYQRSNIKLITSGNKGQAQRIKDLLLESGIPNKDILMQTTPKDTIEEAIEIKKRLKDEPFILITSAYHMPRSMTIFKQADLNPIPAPTDFQDNIQFWSRPQGKNILSTERAWHEYLGLLWLKIRN